ncbi:unknown [Clostridium sp. CAG:306]|nr:unknown [Clostridium sp. CAG:306]DAB20585.1 MAG TPA: hypothetical protein CPT85_09620 [Candidatus Gastranaerophilales bacterium HUM_21]
MVQGVGPTGNNSGSMSDIYLYNMYKNEWETYRKNHPESSMSFEDYLQMKGYLNYFNQQVENYVETGSTLQGDGQSGNTLSTSRMVANQTSSIYQGEDEETYYEFDYDSGTYRKIEGKEDVAKALGLSSEQNVDTIVFGYDSVAITDYTFGNLDDGQDSSSYRVNGKYSNVTLTNQEFDIHYILNALLMDPTDPQYQIAKGVFDDLCAHASQWLPDTDMDELDAVAAEYGTNSAEYKAKLQEILLKNLDQAQEWVEEHTHVKNTSASGSLIENDTTTDGTGGTDGTDGSENTTGTIPDYDKSSVLNSAGLLADYTNNTIWQSEKVNRSGKSQEECRSQALAKSSAYAESVLSQVESTLIAQLGDQCTEEIQKYIAKAKQTALENKSWQSTEWHSAMLNKNKGFTSTCEVRTLVDIFFNEFNTLCQNKGKTNAEVEAEKKAAEEKAAREKSAYQSIYNTDYQSLASEVGANKDIQVVNASSAAEIQSKAESEILNPIKNKIIAQYAGTITASDLQNMLDNAATAALSDCTEWASTTNNYVYTIDSSLLISKFQENVKTIIQNKGYLA